MSLRRQRISSPGPPWAVLSQPSPSSSPSTQTSLIRSDIDVNMSNDEAENDLFSPHIPKRKADENIPSRRVTKLPRLDLSASQPPSCKLSSTSGTENVAGPSRTQPALVLPSRRSGGAQVRTASGDSSSESPGFGGTLSQAVQTINRKEREKEREKATRSRRPLGTARKKTCQPKNVRKVTTAALLWTAQLAGGDSVNDSLARTRIRPKKKQLRLNLDEVTAHSRPLDTVKNRGEIIELTDSSDSVRRPRPSQTSSSARPRIGAGSGAMLSASRDDPIVITSGSEDGRFPGTSPTPSQRNRDRDRAPASRQSKDKSCSGTWTRVPPPAAVDVISIPDSDEDAAPGSAPVPAPPRPVPVLVSTSTSKGRVLPHTSVSRVHASPAPAPPATPVAHQPPLGLQEGPSQRPPDPQPQPLENSPPDDVDDGDDGAFFDFDPVLDGDQSGELDWAVEPGPGPDTGMSGGGWGGSPVVTLGDADASAFTPAAANVPTCHRSDDAGLPRGDPTTPPLSPGLPSTAPVDALPPEPIEEDTMFDSYINMEEPFAVNDQETAETGTGGASQIVSEVTCAAMEAEIGVPGRTPEDGRACRRGAPGPSTLENGQIVADLNDVDECDGAHVGARQGIGHADGDRDVTMDLEPGEVDPNDLQVAPHIPGTPESGEIICGASATQAELPLAPVPPPIIQKGKIDAVPVSGSELGSPARGQAETQVQVQTPTQKPSIISPSHTSYPILTRLAPTPTTPDLSHTVAPTPLSSSSTSTSTPSAKPPNPHTFTHAHTFVMPDISSYKGIRFKRTPSDARENSFFSRALGGMRSMRKAQISGGGGEGMGKTGISISKDVSGPVQLSSSVVEPVREEAQGRTQEGDVAMRDVTVVLADRQPEELGPSCPDAVALHSPLQTSQPPARASQLLTQAPEPLTGAMQPLVAPTPSRLLIAPPRVPRPYTPINLTDAIDQVRRERLKAIGSGSGSQSKSDSSGLARKRSVVDLSGEDGVGNTSRSGDESCGISQVPSQAQTQVQLRSHSRPTIPFQTSRLLSRTSSLDSIRSLLAKHSRPPSQLSLSTTTSLQNPSAKLASNSIDASDTQSSGSGSGSVNRTTPLSASSRSGDASKSPNMTRRHAPLVPFEAFISPVRSKDKDKDGGKGKKVDEASVSPIATRRVVGRSSTGSQRPRVRSHQHERRQPASAVFEAYIVRAPLSNGASTDDPRVRNTLSRPPRPKRFSEGSLLSWPTSPLAPAPTPPPRISMKNSAVDDARQVDAQPDASTIGAEVNSGTNDVRFASSTSVDERAISVRTQQTKNERDDADQLLELASVHLGQDQAAEAVPVEHMQTEVMVDVPGDTTGDAEGTPVDNQSDTFVDVTMDIADEMEELSQATQQVTLCASPAGPDGAGSKIVSESDVSFDASRDAPQAGGAEAATLLHRGSTTPDPVLPEDDTAMSLIAPHGAKEHMTGSQSIRDDSTQEATRVHCRRIVRRRLLVESEDSEAATDMCATMLNGADGAELGSEAELVASVSSSSRTASSMSLSRRSSRSRSLHRLPSRLRPLSRDASSVDPLDIIKTTTHLSGQLEDESGQESIGGYRVVTWKSYVAEQRERVPEFKLAKDLPHSLQDHMSALPAKYRNSEIGRKVFEAVIRQATFGEPDAPPIEIFDNGVGDEVTPQWEFVYTNEMWLGEGVPPPDVKNLKSCGCVGKCDPKSKTCACAKRQLEWLQHYIDADIFSATWPGSPFVYDHRGILQRPDCPIFECNQFCSCDDDCPNRVVQHGRRLPVHIVKTMHKGWGVSAGAKKIPRGSYVGIYAGELLTEQEGEERGRYYDIYGRTYLFSVDFHHLKTGMQDPDDWDNIYVVDAYHAGNFTRFLNHSCDPNCSIYACYINEADVEKPLLVVFTTRDVDPWEELCFSYYGDIEEKRAIIEEARKAGEKESAKDHAVYALCRCEADNCIGRLFT